MQQRHWNLIRDISFVLIGAFVLAFSVNYFIIPNMLSEGGVIGLTVILVYLFDWSPGVVNFALNAGLVIVGYKFFTKRALTYTALSVVSVAVFLLVTEGGVVRLRMIHCLLHCLLVFSSD